MGMRTNCTDNYRSNKLTNPTSAGRPAHERAAKKTQKGQHKMLTAAEQIAERIEEAIIEARAKGVNVYAFVQGGAQGGVYVTDEKIKSLLGVIRETLDDIEQTDDETLRSFGGISYGL
jgi:hypothetical protein